MSARIRLACFLATLLWTGASFAVNNDVQAQSHDDAWQSAWATNARCIYQSGSGKVAGKTLQIGDSITHANPGQRWARQGAGQTSADQTIVSWARLDQSGNPWPGSQTDATFDGGGYLAAADTSGQRGMTASGGISAAEFLSGSGNGGTTMPPITGMGSARTTISDGSTYSNNIHIDTLVEAFADAEFAFLMLGTNDISGGRSSSAITADLTTIIGKLEAKNIVVILCTVPPRIDSGANTTASLALNVDIRALAQSRGLPLLDMEAEFLARDPSGANLLSGDGIHPSATNGGLSTTSDPYGGGGGGNAATHTTGSNAGMVGYLLRNWLIVQKLKEIKAEVVDDATPCSGFSVSIAANPTSGNAPLTVNLSASAVNATGTVSWSWDFGDGGTTVDATTQTTSVTYANPGPYTITLTGTDSSGSKTDAVTITVNSSGGGGTLTLQEGLAGYTGVVDSAIVEDQAANDNLGAFENAIFGSGNTGIERRTVIYYPLPGVLNSATINSATLKLYVFNGGGASGSITAHTITTDWLGNSTKVSWNEADPGTAWTTAGGDFNATPEATFAGSPADANSWITFDVTSLVQSWASGGANFGILVRSDGSLQFRIRQSEYTVDTTLRPILEVVYNGGGGSDTMAPTLTADSVDVGGSTNDPTATMTFAGAGVTLTGSASSFTLNVPVGTTNASVRATDAAGNWTLRSISVQ